MHFDTVIHPYRMPIVTRRVQVRTSTMKLTVVSTDCPVAKRLRRTTRGQAPSSTLLTLGPRYQDGMIGMMNTSYMKHFVTAFLSLQALGLCTVSKY